jgi:hypothetical protein
LPTSFCQNNCVSRRSVQNCSARKSRCGRSHPVPARPGLRVN